MRHAFFSSDISNKIADNLGYITDAELRYRDIRKPSLIMLVDCDFFCSFREIQRIDQSLELNRIESSKASIRTWIFEKE